MLNKVLNQLLKDTKKKYMIVKVLIVFRKCIIFNFILIKISKTTKSRILYNYNQKTHYKNVFHYKGLKKIISENQDIVMSC